MTDNDMIKYLRDHGLTNGCSLGHHSGTNDLIADRMIALIKENNRQKAEIKKLQTYITNHPYRIVMGTADIYTENYEEYEKLLAKISAEAVKEFAERLKEKFSHLEYVINSSRKTIPIQTVKAEVDAILQNGCSNVIDSVRKEMEVD